MGGGMAAETHDERRYESFSHAGHDTPSLPPLPLLPADLLRRSFVICATRISSLLRSTVVGRETVFPVHTSPTSVIVRFFSLSQTVSVVSHKKRNRKFMTVLSPLLTFLLFSHQSDEK